MRDGLSEHRRSTKSLVDTPWWGTAPAEGRGSGGGGREGAGIWWEALAVGSGSVCGIETNADSEYLVELPVLPPPM